MKIALYIAEGLVADFAAMEQVPLLDEHIMAALLSLDLSLMQSSRLFPIVGNVLEQQCRHHALPVSHPMTKIDPFTGDPTV